MSKEFTEDSLWELCTYMRKDGMNISDYVEQGTALLFLKTLEESDRVEIVTPEEETKKEKDTLQIALPEDARWSTLVEYAENESDDLETDIIEKYEEIVYALQHDGELAQNSFKNFSPKFNSHSTLKEVIVEIESYDLWDDFQSNTEVFGDAYEFLLEKYADKADGAGEYFTPRPLIETMVETIDPEYTETVYDPASGTNGFLINAYNHVGKKTSKEYDGEEVMFADTPSDGPDAFDENMYSRELNHDTYRLGIMNLLLHGVDARKVNHWRGDSLNRGVENLHDVIIANPPYGGGKSSEFEPGWATTSKPELNFLQLIMQSLDEDGRAAVIVPEGVLFQQGSAQTVRQKLLEMYNLHTILVLPENTFHPYAGVDANVLFFERDDEGTEEVWYYDMRSETDGIKESNPLTSDMFDEFLECFEMSERDDCENFFKAPVDEIEEEDYALNYKTYKEFVYDDDYRDPSSVLADMETTVESLETEINQLKQLTGDTDD